MIKKSWLLLSYKQKKNTIYIFILMLLAMLLESLSIGIVIPLISLLLEGNVEESFFNYFFSFVDLTGNALIFSGLIVTAVIFLIKNLTLTFNLWEQTKFLRNLYFEFTNNLFQYYLKNDYIFFLQNNSAHLYRNLTSIISAFVSYIKGYIIFISEIIVLTGIVCILLYVNLLETLFILLLVGIFSTIIYFLTIKKINYLGRERNIIGTRLNKHLLQGIASAKDVKILDREEDFIHQVDKNVFKAAKLNHIIQFITGFPRYMFEILMAFTLVVLIFFMIASNKDTVEIIKYLGLVAVASFRIIPGVSRLLSSYQSIKYLEPSTKILLEEFSSKDNLYVKRNQQIQSSNAPLQFKKEINIKNLSFSYPARKEFSLSKISMTIKKGDVIGIVGETGSGKSTLVNLIIGLLEPSSGKVQVDALDINTNLPDWYSKIGYVPQSVYLTDDTIRKNIAFGLREHNIDDNLVRRAVERANLSEFTSNLSEGLETIVGEKGIRLSGGQQQRIGIARALYRDADILILDEATSSLDQMTEKKIMESVQYLRRKKTLIIITHRLSTVKNCDRIFLINQGQITKQGRPEEILNDI